MLEKEPRGLCTHNEERELKLNSMTNEIGGCTHHRFRSFERGDMYHAQLGEDEM